MNAAVRSTLAGLLLLSAATACARPYTRNVAIVVYENAEPLDWAGPYEVYHDAAEFGRVHGQPAFNVYIVSRKKSAVDAQGLVVMPSYSIQDAPKPDIVVFPGGPANRITDDAEFFAWAKKVSMEAEIAQSVCTGAAVLGKAGLLDGLEVTTFHGFIDGLQKRYPKTAVKRGRRFVDNGRVLTTAGISAGIDGSLHVVARLLGRLVADDVARYMEYAWSPEASLAGDYSYLNPSTDERGRKMQVGDLHYSSRNYGEAEKTYRALLDENAKDADTWRSLALSLKAQDRHLPAAEAFVRQAETSNDEMVAYTWYSAAVEYAKAGQKEKAIGAIEKALAAPAGHLDRDAIAREPALAAVVSDARVKKLLAAK